MSNDEHATDQDHARVLRRFRPTGFTLVELIVTMSIFAMVAAMAMPLISSTDEFALPFAAQTMQRDFEWAQLHAQRVSDNVVVIVYPWSNEYGFWDQYPSWDIHDHPFWKSGDMGPSGMMHLPTLVSADAVNITSALLDGSNYYFQYNVRGEPVNLWNESLPITGDRQVVLRQGSRQYTLEVTPIIGTVRVTEN